MEETKIIYHIDDEDTPYLVKLPIPADQVTLGDFKNVLNRPNYKFFFKSMDDDFGWVDFVSTHLAEVPLEFHIFFNEFRLDSEIPLQIVHFYSDGVLVWTQWWEFLKDLGVACPSFKYFFLEESDRFAWPNGTVVWCSCDVPNAALFVFNLTAEHNTMYEMRDGPVMCRFL